MNSFMSLGDLQMKATMQSISMIRKPPFSLSLRIQNLKDNTWVETDAHGKKNHHLKNKTDLSSLTFIQKPYLT